jgi:hypothetical protein
MSTIWPVQLGVFEEHPVFAICSGNLGDAVSIYDLLFKGAMQA